MMRTMMLITMITIICSDADYDKDIGDNNDDGDFKMNPIVLLTNRDMSLTHRRIAFVLGYCQATTLEARHISRRPVAEHSPFMNNWN